MTLWFGWQVGWEKVRLTFSSKAKRFFVLDSAPNSSIQFREIPAMAEELPENVDSPDAPIDGETGAEPRRRRNPLTWVVLLTLLVAAIGILASDVFRGRIPQSKAFEWINGKLKPPQSDDSEEFGGGIGGRRGGDRPSQPALTADAVHELLGRLPDSTEKRNGNLNGHANSDVELEPLLVETYKFPGIIKAYEVVVTYLVIPASETKPATTALKFVRKK